MRRLAAVIVLLFATALTSLFLSPVTPAEAVDAAPSVTSILPNNGPSTSRTHITITGTGFSSTPTVVIGGAAATNVQRVNATTLTAITIANTAGVKNVVVTNPDGQVGTGAGLFTVTAVRASGGTWSRVERFVAGAAVKAVAISQANNATTPIITVAASGVPGQAGLIHRSLDRGLTWTNLNGPIAPDGQGDDQHSGWWAELVASADGQKLFLRESVTHQCCSVGSIWVSSDGGTTWSRANAGFANNRLLYSDIAMSADGTKLWAAVGHPSRDGGKGIYYSANGGTTWSKLPNARFPGAAANDQRYDSVSVSSDGQKIAVSAWDNSRWYSLDGGTTFTAWEGRAFEVSVDGEYAYGRPTFSAGSSSFPTAITNVFACDRDCNASIDTTRIATAPGGKILATPEFGGVARARFSYNGGYSWVTTSLTTADIGCSSGQAAGEVALSSDGTLGALSHPGCGLVLGVFEGLPPPTLIDLQSITGEFGTAIGAGTRAGWNGGGRLIEITGKDFQNGARVSFGRSHNNPNQVITFGTNAVFINSTKLRVTTPAVDYTAFVSVYVTNPDGETSTYGFGRSISEIGLCNPQAGVAYCFQYSDAGMLPGTLVLTPNSGLPAGGTVVDVAITTGGMGPGGDDGTAFDWNQGITFDGTLGTNGAQRCGQPCGWRITTPPHAEGPVDVAVRFNLAGEVISKTTVGAFTYASLGAITAVTPGNGGTAGGRQVEIRGAGFVTGATVRFGTVLATNVNVLNSTTLTATAPANAAGTVGISVANVAGSWGVGSNLFTYVASPTVTSVAANSGRVIGGAAVTITGTGFSAGASVTFGGVTATGVAIVNATTITATTPAREAGLVDVVVTNTDASGSGTGTGVFTYISGPRVISLNVISGGRAGGNPVIITGTDFSANPTVRVGLRDATNVVRLSATRISIRMPVGITGLATVFVTNTDNQVGSGRNLYRYYDLNTRANRQRESTITILDPQEAIHSNAAPTTLETTTASRQRNGQEDRSATVRVTVPIGAIPTADRIVVEPVASLAEVALTAPTSIGTLLTAVSAQALDTDGNEVTTNFNSAVSIVVTVPANSVPTGATPTNMSMKFWSGTEWSTVSSTSVLEADGSMTVTALASHFTLFAATYIAPAAAAAVTNCCSSLVTPTVYTVTLDGLRVVHTLAPSSAAINASDSTVVTGNVVNTTTKGGEEYGSTGRITVPAGAVPGGASVVLQSVDSLRELSSAAPLPSGRIFAAASAQVLNASQQPITDNFIKPATIAITLPAAAVSGIAVADLQLRYWSGTEWVVVPSKVQAHADGSVTVSAEVLHFTLFAVTVPTAPATTGTFITAPSFGAGYLTLVVFNGGSVDQLEAAVRQAGASGAWVQDANGTFSVLIPGGPATLRDAFVRSFPKEFAPMTPVLLVRSTP